MEEDDGHQGAVECLLELDHDEMTTFHQFSSFPLLINKNYALLALQVPGPGPQTGLGVGGPVVGTTTFPGPSPVRGSGSKPEKPLPHEENDGLFAPSLSQSLLTIISRKTNPEL